VAIPCAILIAFIAGAATYATLWAFGETSALVRIFWALLAAGAVEIPAYSLWSRFQREGESRPERQQRIAAAEGLAHLRRGESEAAQRLLEACLAGDPMNAPAWRALAEIAFRRGDGEEYLRASGRLLALAGALSSGERVALCHRQADVCLARLADPARAVEALVRIELDYPGSADALRARQRIEAILARREGETG